MTFHHRWGAAGRRRVSSGCTPGEKPEPGTRTGSEASLATLTSDLGGKGEERGGEGRERKRRGGEERGGKEREGERREGREFHLSVHVTTHELGLLYTWDP